MTKLTPEQLEERKQNYRENKEAYKARAKAWKLANKEKTTLSNKKTYLKAEYGLSWETYEAMFKQQDGRCAICTKPLNFMGDKATHTSDACVDHCHTTGQIRGLLCKLCNLGIGNFRDNTLFLEKAIEYLKGYHNAPVG